MSILCTGSADHKGGGVAELKPYKVGHKNLLYSHNCFRFPSFQLFGGMGPRTSRVKAQRCPGHCIADDEQNGNYGEDTFSPGLQSRQNQLKTHRMEGEAKYEHKSWIQFVSDILKNQQYSPAQKNKLDQYGLFPMLWVEKLGITLHYSGHSIKATLNALQLWHCYVLACCQLLLPSYGWTLATICPTDPFLVQWLLGAAWHDWHAAATFAATL